MRGPMKALLTCCALCAMGLSPLGAQSNASQADTAHKHGAMKKGDGMMKKSGGMTKKSAGAMKKGDAMAPKKDSATADTAKKNMMKPKNGTHAAGMKPAA